MAKIKIERVRLAFPDLFVATSVNDGAPTFGASFLIEPTDKQVKKINAVIEQVAADKWGAKSAAVLATIQKADRTCLHDGDMKADYAGFEGMLYISASNKVRPLVIDRDRSPLTQQDGKPYAGCYVNATIDIWAMDNKYGKRICAQLMGVQFDKDGDAFTGGGIASADDFDDLGEGADADFEDELG